MTIRDYLQATVNYIEASIDSSLDDFKDYGTASKDVLSLEAIEHHIGFSRYYLNAMFSVYTGLSIMAYVRKYKLSNGLIHVKNGQRISDVAYQLGYSSERAFSRAVSEKYGHSPSYFRDSPLPQIHKLKIYNLSLDIDDTMFNDAYPKSQQTIQTRLMEKGVIAMKSYLSDVRYETILPMTVISGVAVGSEPEEQIISLMDRLSETYGITVNRRFGFDSPVEGEQDATQYRGYEYWHVVNAEEIKKLPSEAFTFEQTDICVKTIPGYRYATLTIDDPFAAPFERIPGGWKALVHWLESHDFKDFKLRNDAACEGGLPQSANCLEEVLMLDEDPDKTVMRIFIPTDAI